MGGGLGLKTSLKKACFKVIGLRRRTSCLIRGVQKGAAYKTVRATEVFVFRNDATSLRSGILLSCYDMV